MDRIPVTTLSHRFWSDAVSFIYFTNTLNKWSQITSFEPNEPRFSYSGRNYLKFLPLLIQSLLFEQSTALGANVFC